MYVYEETLSRPGADLFFVDYQKSGNPIFLINGYTRTHSDFRAMSRFFTEKGVRVVTCDNRGAGKSMARVPFSMDEMADDVFEILKTLKLNRVNLLGISMGGIIAQRVVERYPGLVSKVVLVSTTSDPEQINSGSHEWPDTAEGVYKKMETYFTEEFVARNKILIQAMVKNIMSSIEGGDFEVQSHLQSRAIAGAQLDMSKDPLDVPALVIHGAKDQIIPVESAEDLTRRFVDCEKMIFDDAGHLLIAEKSKDLYESVFKFIHKV